MLDRLEQTLVRIKAFYDPYTKRAYETATFFSLAAIVFSFTMTLMVGYVVWKIGHLPEFMKFMSYGEFIISGLFWNGSSILEGFTILFLGLFIVRMDQEGDLRIKQMSFRNIFDGITGDNWSTFIMALIALCIIEIILFIPLIDHSENGWGSIVISEPDLQMGTSKVAKYFAWLNNIMDLFKNYSVYLLIVYLLLSNKKVRFTRSGLRPFWPSILTVIISMFIFDALFSHTYYFISAYILPPITIPFEGSMIAVAFLYITAIVTIAWFLPFIALLFIAPFGQTDPKPIDPVSQKRSK